MGRSVLKRMLYAGVVLITICDVYLYCVLNSEMYFVIKIRRCFGHNNFMIQGDSKQSTLNSTVDWSAPVMKILIKLFPTVPHNPVTAP